MAAIEVALTNTNGKHAICDLPPEVALFVASCIDIGLDCEGECGEEMGTEENIAFARDLMIQLRNQADHDEDGVPYDPGPDVEETPRHLIDYTRENLAHAGM